MSNGLLGGRTRRVAIFSARDDHGAWWRSGSRSGAMRSPCPSSPAKAREKFEKSAFDLFRKSLRNTMTKGVDLDAYLGANLIGAPDQVCEKVAALQEAGVDHLCSLLFVGNTVEEMLAQIRAFARYVLPAFPA
jgi:alkanesulfonate monooxygenase SsuD/methylene tetrahydromethanopterin reductase-like flavin-dependent oxidoreductase (luciferase family)